MKPRHILAIAIFCFSANLGAQESADLQVSLSAPASHPADSRFSWTATVRNLGPGTAADVRLATTLHPLGEPCTGTIASIPPETSHTITCAGTMTVPPYVWSISVSAESPTPDPNPDDNVFGRFVHPLTNPDLALGFVTGLIDPGLPFDLVVSIVNASWSEATNVELTLEVPRSQGFERLPSGCIAIDDQSARCSFAWIPPREDPYRPGVRELAFSLVAPDDPSGSTVDGTGTIVADRPGDTPFRDTFTFSAKMLRTFFVTSRDDSGSGTLRAAIEDVNSSCDDTDPCGISFRIEPVEGERWQTIAVHSPLPAVTAVSVIIDGDTQRRFFGDRNPDGPEIELNGAAIEGTADGLRLAAACSVWLENLAINGFPGSGVLAAGNDDCAWSTPGAAWRVVRSCYVGTDPTGMTAVPNRHGIVVAYAVRGFPDYQDAGPGAWRIEGNLVSGNTRSGIVSLSGTRLVTGNRIGLNRDLSAGLGNGASGVYVGPDSHGTDVAHNHIGFNHDFGVAIDRDAANVALQGNSIHANWQGGIDIGLDGVTPAIGPFPEGGSLLLPEIRQAFWDPEREVTVIDGVLPEPGTPILGYDISVYASDVPDRSGFGEGQYFLGVVKAEQGTGRFEFHAPADLRGKWITATATRSHYVGFAKPPSPTGSEWGFLKTTSEFGRAVPVQ
jgi:hypothetical protein